ncbi:MAG TPA: hypothetical protein VMT03_22080 [Polyangia bacterium]|nr:hypothetical protein [Polyangia bacterium]
MDERTAPVPRTEPFNGVRTFTATLARDREALGERVTAWIRENPDKRIVDTAVTQSSDSEFHCLAITLFFWETARKSDPR